MTVEEQEDGAMRRTEDKDQLNVSVCSGLKILLQINSIALDPAPPRVQMEPFRGGGVQQLAVLKVLVLVIMTCRNFEAALKGHFTHFQVVCVKLMP